MSAVAMSSISDRLGKDHLVVKHGAFVPTKADVVEAEELLASVRVEDTLVPSEIRGSLNLMTDEELVALAKGGLLDAVDVLLKKYDDALRMIARRCAGRYRMEYDDCAVLVKKGLFVATRTFKESAGKPFRNYLMRAAFGELRKESVLTSRAKGYARVGWTGKNQYARIATVVEDAVQGKSGDEFNHSDFAEEKERKTDQMVEILAAEQQAHNYVGSALQLAKDGEQLAAFLRSLPPFQADEAKRMMRGMSVEDSMAETGRPQKTITKARNEIDRLTEQWGIA